MRTTDFYRTTTLGRYRENTNRSLRATDLTKTTLNMWEVVRNMVNSCRGSLRATDLSQSQVESRRSSTVEASTNLRPETLKSQRLRDIPRFDALHSDNPAAQIT